MKEEITKLIHLQEIDSEIAGFDAAIAAQERNVTDREKSIKEKDAAIAACDKKSEKLVTLQRETKTDNEDAAEKIKERQNKMMQVQTSREHQALLKEIEESKKQLKETEEKLLRIMEQSEELKEEKTELENLRKGEEELLKEEISQVEKEVKKINSSRKKVSSKREALTKELTPSLMKRYNKLLAKRDGIAVVKVIDSVCQGCFMTIPPQKFNEVRRNDVLYPCPNCQRIMYYAEEEEAVEEKA